MTIVTSPESTAASDEWYAWREGLATARVGYIPLDNLAQLEQLMLRSHKETRCAECGEAGAVWHVSGLIKSVDHYYLCDACDAHFEGSVGGNKYTVLQRRDGFEHIVKSLGNRREADRLARMTIAGRVRRNAA